MVGKERDAGNLETVGGSLCLDFANTVSTRKEDRRNEYLTDYHALVRWACYVRVLSKKEGRVLLHKATRHPGPARDALDQAIALREVIYRVFSAVTHKTVPRKADLLILNTSLRTALSAAQILPSEKGFEWAWAGDRENLHQVIWPVVRSAADLLTSGDLSRVRECAREGCNWLFLDLSKNQRRRWCSMTMCGSRIKARRYYRRKKGDRG